MKKFTKCHPDTTIKTEATSSEELSDTIMPLQSSMKLDHTALKKEVEKLQHELREVQTEKDQFHNQFLRTLADLENIRKRTAIEIENSHKYSLSEFIVNLLPVVDSMENAITIAVENNTLAKQFHTGIEMTLKLMLDLLEKSSLKIISPKIGETFDPAFHQAISTKEDPNASANTICQILQKGYSLHNRLIRPALVIVFQ